LTPKDEKDTNRDSSLEDVLVVDNPGEEATGKDDQCFTIGQEKPLTGCAVQPLVQDLLMEAVVDTRAVVSILGMEHYGSLGCKSPIKSQVSLMQTGLIDQLREFLAGPFSIQVGENIHQVDLYVLLLKNPIFLGLDFLQGQNVILDLVHSTLSVGGETTRTVQKELVDTFNYNK
jgi:hypothetical protein